MKLLIAIVLTLAVIKSEFTVTDLRACYQTCLKQTSQGVKQTTQAYNGLTAATAKTNLYAYDNCVRGTSLIDLNSYLDVTGTIAGMTEGVNQKSYCRYLFGNNAYTDTTVTPNVKVEAQDIIDPKQLNQEELRSLAEKCFKSGTTLGCQIAGFPGGSTSNNGLYHYYQSFEDCIDGCIESTAVVAKQVYDQCDTKCQQAYLTAENISTSFNNLGVTTNSNTFSDHNGWQAYRECIDKSGKCARIDGFYGFSDYQYKQFWQDCYPNDCDSKFTGATGVSQNGKDYFTCRSECKIPDHTEFTLVDNTVAVYSNIINFGLVATIALLISILI